MIPKFFLSVFLGLVLFQVVQCVLGLEFSRKIVSDREDDGFAFTLATSHHRLVIGAIEDHDGRGSVMVNEDGDRIEGPDGEKLFGYNLDVNHKYMVVSGGYDECGAGGNIVYVYR